MEKEIHIVISPTGEPINESIGFNERECQQNFVKYFSLPVVRDYLGGHDCWTLWQCYERAGYKMKTITIKDYPETNIINPNKNYG